MEFSGYGTVQPIYSTHGMDVRASRAIEGGWFVSGPSQVEKQEEMRLMARREREDEDKAKSSMRRTKALSIVHKARIKIQSHENMNQYLGEDPSTILDTFKSGGGGTTTTKAALKALDGKSLEAIGRSGSQASRTQGSHGGSRSKHSDILGCPTHLVTFRGVSEHSLPAIRGESHQGSQNEMYESNFSKVTKSRSKSSSSTWLPASGPSLPAIQGARSTKLGRSAKSKLALSAMELGKEWMPLMSKQDVARYRNSISQNVCQDLLMKVF